MTSTTTSSPAVDSRLFRNVMGLFATGVTVIATRVDGEIHGMTANAVSSVSLDPLLVLVCVQRNAHMADFLRASREFSINILSEEQAALSNYFAGLWTQPTPPPFEFVPWQNNLRLAGTLGALACRVEEFLEGGDHWIIIGRVVDLYREASPGNPLLYYTGQYRQIANGVGP